MVIDTATALRLKPDFIDELDKIGVSVSSNPTLMDLIAGFSDAVHDLMFTAPDIEPMSVRRRKRGFAANRFVS